jgi:hypothetical protein
MAPGTVVRIDLRRSNGTDSTISVTRDASLSSHHCVGVVISTLDRFSDQFGRPRFAELRIL